MLQIFAKKQRPLRIAPETKREILPSHPPPQNSKGTKIVHVNNHKHLLEHILPKKHSRPYDVDVDGVSTPRKGKVPYAITVDPQSTPKSHDKRERKGEKVVCKLSWKLKEKQTTNIY